MRAGAQVVHDVEGREDLGVGGGVEEGGGHAAQLSLLPLREKVAAGGGRMRGFSAPPARPLTRPAARATLSRKGRGDWRVALPFPRKGAILSSHGETVADLNGLLKDGAQRRRVAAAQRAVLDQPVQVSTLQPSRDVRRAPTLEVNSSLLAAGEAFVGSLTTPNSRRGADSSCG